MTPKGTIYKAELPLGPDAIGPSHVSVRIEVITDQTIVSPTKVVWGYFDAPTAVQQFNSVQSAITAYEALVAELKTLQQ